MAFDEHGLMWLTEPWLALVVFSGVIGLVLWSHRWIVIGRAPTVRRMAVRMPRFQRLQHSSRGGRRIGPARTPASPFVAGEAELRPVRLVTERNDRRAA